MREQDLSMISNEIRGYDNEGQLLFQAMYADVAPNNSLPKLTWISTGTKLSGFVMHGVIPEVIKYWMSDELPRVDRIELTLDGTVRTVKPYVLLMEHAVDVIYKALL